MSLLCVAEKFVLAVMHLKLSSSSDSFGGPGYFPARQDMLWEEQAEAALSFSREPAGLI